MEARETILWSGHCTWWRVLLWRWKDVAAIAFMLLVMTQFKLVTVPLDALGVAVARNWFGWHGWREIIANPYTFIAMGAAAGWFVGQVFGSLSSHRGRRFSITEEHIVWGNAGEAFKSPISSITSVKEGRAADGGTVLVTFGDGRNDLLIAGVASARSAAAAIRSAKDS